MGWPGCQAPRQEAVAWRLPGWEEGDVMRAMARAAGFVIPAALALVAGMAGGAGASTLNGSSAAASQGSQCPWVTSTAPVRQRVDQVMAHMTLAEKIAELGGSGSSPYVGHVPAQPQLCIPAINLEDGPAGVADGMTGVTQLPAPVAMASTWNPAMAQQYGTVIGAEERGKGATVNLGPTINIVRDPRWGRAFETLGEDPYLTGQMASAEIRAVQGQGVISQAKHFDVYNQETYRNTPADDAIVSDRVMHEIYLPAFHAAIDQGKAGSLMCAYSTVNGEYSCQNSDLLTKVLRDQWHYTGFVTSDWGATHSTVPSANAGLDMQMPDNSYFGAALQQAVQDGQVSMATINAKVRHILTELFRFNMFASPPSGSPSAVVTSPAHAAAARAVAEQGTVLLKNAGPVLPLRTSRDHSIAVIGPDAGSSAMTAGGGSASVTAPYVVTPYQGISHRAGSGATVRYAEGIYPNGQLPAVPASAFGSGLSVTYYNGVNLSGSPIATGTDPSIDDNWNGGSPAPGVPGTNWSATFKGTLTPPATGTYTFSLTSDDGSRLFVNGQEVINNWAYQAATTKTGTVQLTAGTPVSIEVDYFQGGGASTLSLGWQVPGAPSPMDQAVALAKSSDVAVVFASNFESEGSDLQNIDLPADENQLISAVAQANPNTIVVLNTGSAVTMPWVNQVKGVLEAWYPGQEDGNAIAALLFGDVDPSGHLPVTFPQSLSQVPASTPAQWPGVNGKVQYSEGLDVGYRWYDARGITPLFPFGYGLSYTTFRFSHLVVAPSRLGPRGQVTVTADVTNTGDRAGADVVQAYVADPPAAGEPPRQLKGFQRVWLRPGQTARVVMHLSQHAFQVWSTQAQQWTTVDGTYRVMVGDSSANLPLGATVTVPRTTGTQYVTVSAPSPMQAGKAVAVSATFTNTGDWTVHHVQAALSAPSGWRVTPASPAALQAVGAHASGHVTWTVTPPAGAGGPATLRAAVTYQGVGGPGQATGTASVQIPYPSLAAAFNNIGVSNDGDAAEANYDGDGYSWSAQALAAVHITPGASVPVSGQPVPFTWPDAAPGQPDNVAADGRMIALSGQGSALAFLGSGTFGTQSGTVTVTYTDGTTSSGTLTLADWYANAPAPGDTLVATAPHWNEPAGSTLSPNQPVSLYASSIPLTAGKTVAYVTLPDNPDLHVFAMAIQP